MTKNTSCERHHMIATLVRSLARPRAPVRRRRHPPAVLVMGLVPRAVLRQAQDHWDERSARLHPRRPAGVGVGPDQRRPPRQPLPPPISLMSICPLNQRSYRVVLTGHHSVNNWNHSYHDIEFVTEALLEIRHNDLIGDRLVISRFHHQSNLHSSPRLLRKLKLTNAKIVCKDQLVCPVQDAPRRYLGAIYPLK